MKKTLAIILTAVMVLSMVITAIPFSASAEDAVVLDPKNEAGLSIGKVAEGYTTDLTGATAIGTAEEFKNAISVSGTNYGSFYLTADIDLTTIDYMPVYGVFEGNFDGCGYTVTTNAPLFYGIGSGDTDLVANNCANSVIKNLNIVADIDVAELPALADGVGYSIGAIACFACPAKDKLLEYTNIRVTGTIKGDDVIDITENEDEACTGGLVGAGYGGFDMSYVFIDDMTITGACAGGVYGSASIGTSRAGQQFTVENCYVNADIIQDGSNGTADGGADRVAAAGLFAYAQHSNITIKNVEIYGTITANTGVYVAGIIGRSAMAGDPKGTVLVEDCKVYADIVSNKASTSSWAGAGAIFGIPQFTGEKAENNSYVIIKNCVNYGDITANHNAGGLVGVNVSCSIRIIGCENYGTIKAQGGALYAGGIVGRADRAVTFGYDPRTGEMVEGAVTVNHGDVITDSFGGGIIGGTGNNSGYVEFNDCINNGEVSAWNAGGIFGFSEKNNETHFDGCVNNGDVYGANIGGIIGKVKKVFTLENCTNNGDIVMVGQDDEHTQKGVGGIAGSIFNTAPEEMKNLTNNGNVYGKDGELYGYNVAGIVGSLGTAEWLASSNPEVWDQASFVNCVNKGNITGAGDVAGIVAHGEYAFIVKDCVNEGNITGKNAAGIVVFGFVGNNLATDTVIENNTVVGTVTGTQSGAAIAIAGEGLDIEACLVDNVIYNTCNANAYISNGSATLTAMYPLVITNPNTGDNFVMGIVLSILAITAMGITAVVVLKKRVRN